LFTIMIFNFRLSFVQLYVNVHLIYMPAYSYLISYIRNGILK
jgi:hypothetical protein